MELDIYQIDAFTDKVFGGNPACVIPLKEWLPENTLLKIAKENSVSETAFFIDNGKSVKLRWFTPELEMDLCGHATLATAHCMKSLLNYPKDTIHFETLSGTLTVSINNGLYSLDLPSRPPMTATLPLFIKSSLNFQPLEVFKSRDYLLLFESEEQIKNIKINRQHFDKVSLGTGGVILTAKGENCDFVSRFFTPQALILEDPVTGSSHCSLVPFWSSRLQKKELTAFQLSQRGGVLSCENKNDRILLTGSAKTYLVGKIRV